MMKHIDLEQILTGDNAEMLKEKMREVQRDIESYAKNPDPEFAETVRTTNIYRVRAHLQIDLRDKQVSFKEIMQKTFYAQQMLPEVFRPFEISKLHQEYLLDSTKWNEDYFQNQFSYLTVNFAVERVIHLANVKHQFDHLADADSPFIHNKNSVSADDVLKANTGNVFEMFWDKVKEAGFTLWEKINENRAVSGLVAVALIVLCLIW
ncbi:TPA: hypothetical protein ACK3JW_000856 [Mannheimia haemolytica]